MRGLRGLIAQGASGNKSAYSPRTEVLSVLDISSGTASVISDRSCWALIYLFGAGGSGSGGNQGGGGGGGAALFKRVRLSPKQSLSPSVGAPGAANSSGTGGLPGGDTTLTLPSGILLTAGGGKAGMGGTVPPPAPGGIATNGDINRMGGAGGGNGGNGSPAGLGGGAGGLGYSLAGSGGGGGGAGFSDVGPSLGGGNGSPGAVNLPGGNYGAGSGAWNSGTAGAGGIGRAVIWLVRLL